MRVPTLFYIDLASNALPLASGAARRAWGQRETRFLYGYVILSALNETLAFALGLLKIRNILLFHIYGILGFLLLMSLFIMWQDNVRMKSALRFAILLYVMFWLYAKVFLEPITELPGYSESVSGLILSIVAMMTIINLIKAGTTEIVQDVRFWACIGVLINFGGNVPLYALSTKLVKLSLNEAFTVWSVHWILTIIFNVALMTSFLCMKRR